jgi:hypothetical protein
MVMHPWFDAPYGWLLTPAGVPTPPANLPAAIAKR